MTDDAPLHPLVVQWRDRLSIEERRSVHTVRAYVATAERLVSFLSDYRGGQVDAPMLSKLEPADLRACLASRRGDGP